MTDFMFPPSIAIFESETTDGRKCFEAHCLDRPGCMTHGTSITDAYTNIWDAIVLYDNNLKK